MKPEPDPSWLPKRPPVVRWIVTTAGETASAALITALDSSIVTSLTVLLSLFAPVMTPDGPSSSRVETPTAERAPESSPATTAIATIGAALRPRRDSTGVAGSGGRVDQAGAACQELWSGVTGAGGP